MADTGAPKYKRKLDIILYYISAIIIPNIFLFNLYDRNRIRNHIPFASVLITAAVFAVISVGLLLLFYWIARSLEGALVLISLFWLLFWLFEQTYTIKILFLTAFTRLGWLIAIITSLMLLSMFFRKRRPHFHKISPAFRILAVSLCGLFVFNFIPALNHQIMVQRGVNIRYEAFLRGEEMFYIKRTFRVNSELPNPNIYWFHMDGMLSFYVIEKYFGDTQDELRNELKNRGFVINETAELNATYTNFALPALLAPAFYDSYFGTRLAQTGHLIGTERALELTGMLTLDGISLKTDIFPNLEFFHALLAANYHTIMITDSRSVLFEWPPLDRRYRVLDYLALNVDCTYILSKHDFSEIRANNHFNEINDLIRLLTITTPLSIISDRISTLLTEIIEAEINEELWLPVNNHEDIIDQLTKETRNTIHERQLYRALIDSFSVPSPKLVYIFNFFTHSSTIKHSNILGMARGGGIPTDVYPVYMAHHEYAAMVMLNKIDMILEKDPSAVIILQSDHGIHDNAELGNLLRLGYTEKQVQELHVSVFSAVRIPPQYGGLDFPLEPRNISRELVNRFVGENYTLLPDRYRN